MNVSRGSGQVKAESSRQGMGGGMYVCMYVCIRCGDGRGVAYDQHIADRRR